jgi:hypothetical protein
MLTEGKKEKVAGVGEVSCGASFHFIGSLATLLCFGIAKLSDFFSCWVMVATQCNL